MENVCPRHGAEFCKPCGPGKRAQPGDHECENCFFGLSFLYQYPGKSLDKSLDSYVPCQGKWNAGLTVAICTRQARWAFVSVLRVLAV